MPGTAISDVSVTDALNVYGPLAVGSILSLFGMGFFLSSVLSWRTMYPNDTVLNKCFVYFILFLTFIDSSMTASRLVRCLAGHPGDLDFFLNTRAVPELWIGPLFAMWTANVCEAFMVLRVVRFARAIRVSYGRHIRVLVDVLTGILLLGMALDLAVGMAPPIYVSRFASIIDVSDPHGGPGHTFRIILDIQLFTFMSMDILITTAMLVELRLARSGFGASNSVLSVLHAIVWRAGLLIVLIQTSQIILFYTTSTAWYALPPLFLGKVRAITVLSVIIGPRVAHSAYQAHEDNARKFGADDCRSPPGVTPAQTMGGSALAFGIATVGPSSDCPSGSGSSGAQPAPSSLGTTLTANSWTKSFGKSTPSESDPESASEKPLSLAATGQSPLMTTMTLPRASSDGSCRGASGELSFEEALALGWDKHHM